MSLELLARDWAAGAGPGYGPLTIDLDSTICVTYGLAKEGSRLWESRSNTALGNRTRQIRRDKGPTVRFLSLRITGLTNPAASLRWIRARAALGHFH